MRSNVKDLYKSPTSLDQQMMPRKGESKSKSDPRQPYKGGS